MSGCANVESKKDFPHWHCRDDCCVLNLQLDPNPDALTFPD